MKNKAVKKTDDFREFKTKIFFRTIVMMTIAVACIFLMYSLFLKGNFANWIVLANQKIFRLDYEAARTLYQWTFRNNIELMFVVGTALVFFIVFRIYLNWFGVYFTEINNGIDEIGRESPEDVSLLPELSAIEKKINTIKHNFEKQKLNMKLEEQQKNDMVMYLAHDLKTPLASVIGYLHLLCDEGQISEELRQKYLSVSLDKAERLEELINEFFEIAKFNLSNITLQYTSVNLTRLLEMLIYEFQPMFNEKKLNCNLKVSEDVMLRCDADKIQRVFDNLLKNAVIYSFEGTDIDIAVTCQGEKSDNAANGQGENIEIAANGQGENIEITFTNHGDTIPEEKLERIFEQFYRLDAARSTAGGGAGLGLAIAKQIVELHNGTITAGSENEMVEFKVILPAS